MPGTGQSPMPGGSSPGILQYIGGGQSGLRPWNDYSTDEFGSYYQGGPGTQSNDPSAPNYLAQARDSQQPYVINLVVDGAVLATVVNGQNALAY